MRRKASRTHAEPLGAVAFSAFSPHHQALLRSLAELLGPSRDAFVVGGAIRDLLLCRAPLGDLDLAVPVEALETAQALAERLGGRYVCLDAARGVGRVVIRSDTQFTQVDLTDFRASSLEADLQGRDFTIDALAASVRRLVEDGAARIADPTGGLADLARRRLRLAGPASFQEDPARALRAVRLAGLLGFSLDPEVGRAARAIASRLRKVAAERIREELTGILALPRAGASLRALDRLSLLPAILPESAPMRSASQPAPHRFSVWEHSLRTVEAVDRLLANLSVLAPHRDRIAAHLGDRLGDSMTRQEVLKLAALLHDVAKPQTRQVVKGRIRFIGHDLAGAEMAKTIAQRLRLSSEATAVLARLVRQHLRLMHLGQLAEVSRRARYRFFRDLGDEAQDLLLLTLADAAAVRGLSPGRVGRGALGRLVAGFLGGWQEDRRQVAVPPLLRGEDVMAAFGLAPGPGVGRLLGVAREAQDLGVVRTREEALEYLIRHADSAVDTPEGGLLP
ncbi:MAG: HD domain-containing protein [Candidatus Methylomirabilia bacterium]